MVLAAGPLPAGYRRLGALSDLFFFENPDNQIKSLLKSQRGLYE